MLTQLYFLVVFLTMYAIFLFCTMLVMDYFLVFAVDWVAVLRARFLFRKPIKQIKIGSWYLTSKQELIKIVGTDGTPLAIYLDNNGKKWQQRFMDGYVADSYFSTNRFKVSFLYELTKRDIKKYWPYLIEGNNG